MANGLPFDKHPAAGSYMRIADMRKGWRFDRKATQVRIHPGCGDRLLLGAEAAAGDSVKLFPLWILYRT